MLSLPANILNNTIRGPSANQPKLSTGLPSQNGKGLYIDKHPECQLTGYYRFISSCEKNKTALCDQELDLDIPPRALTVNDALPDHGAFKSYAKFALETRTGVLVKKNKLMTKKTLKNSMRLIWSALERRTAKGVPKPVGEQVHNVSLNCHGQ